jgi:metal-sulfur cluster biosynthetic enzyme
VSSRKRCAVAVDALFDATRQVAGQLSNGIRRRRIEIRSVDIIESKKKFDAPWSETGASSRARRSSIDTAS